jgi:Protein of unknown function (DUF3489)
MLRLLEIWSRLPGTRPVRRFEDRKTAIARIWRAIQMGAEQKPGTARQSSMRKAEAGKRAVFREQSKAAQVCALLRRPEGATMGEIITATGWQPHTVRGFISPSLRKQGTKVRTFRRGSEHAYQLKR